MNWKEYHSESAKLASQAEAALKEGKSKDAERLYHLAAEAEGQALSVLDHKKRRTLGISVVSAASLYIKAKDYQNAEQVACKYLVSKQLPSFAAEQLQSILEITRMKSSSSRPTPGGYTMESEQKTAVLIVGDSFIDENWLMSRCKVYHSYNVGEEHYLSNLQSANSRIISFCGAASVWGILHGADNLEEAVPSAGAHGSGAKSKKRHLITLSAWNPRDGDLLQCLLYNTKRTWGLTPYRISGLIPPSCKHIGSMFNIVDKGNPKTEDYTSTNRLIRLYEGFGSDQPYLRSRFDWRLELKREYKNYGVVNEIKAATARQEVEAIVIVDHGYGVVDERLVDSLVDAFPQAKWYIRCKLESAPWVSRLAKRHKTLRLIFTDEQLLEYRYGVRVWRHGPVVLGRGALEVLGDLLGLRKYLHTEMTDANPLQAENAALLFEDDTAIGASRIGDPEENDASLINISRPPGDKNPIKVGRSTVFFASLIHWDLMQESLDRSMNNACSWALRNAYRWTESCTRAWLEVNPSDLSGPFPTAVYPLPSQAKPATSTTASSGLLHYNDSWKAWNASSKALGIVEIEGEKQIHLWRAQGTLKEYICPGGKKRSDINELISRLHTYKDERNPKYPFNCLLLAEPGWGKSTLAQCLSRHFEFAFLSYSIAQMASNQDLVNCLKEIVSTQNRTRRRVLVFIDEIDARIENHTALGLLLDPIWGGAFMSDGNVYRIEPCVWVFASTKPLSRLREESKGRDFLSRMNGPIIHLDFFAKQREELEKEKNEKKRILSMADIVRSKKESEPLRTELVYHGVNFLNRVFGPISGIDESVLRVFFDTLPIDGIRSIEILVSRFRDISRGIVSVRNVPKLEAYPELERHIFPLGGWLKEDTEIIVKVVINPPN